MTPMRSPAAAAARSRFLPLPLSLSVCLLLGARAAAQQLPAGFIAEPLGRDWVLPVSLCFLDDGRLLVAEKPGTVWFVENDEKKTLVLDLQAETLNNGDRGLLGIAVDPDFGQNGLLYLLLVVDPNADNVEAEQETFGRLVRYSTHFDAQGNLVADPASRTVLIGSAWDNGIPSLHFSHAIGDLQFLGDGSLLVTAGDGAHFDGADTGGRDPNGFGPGKFSLDQDLGAFRSQYDATLAGKILRVDPATGLGLPDNPYYTGNPADWASRAYAKGLRNPWRLLAVPGTGPRDRVLVAEVGWELWEEVNLLRGGENFGWPCHEGPLAQPVYPGLDTQGFCAAAATAPLLSWHHFDPGTQGYTGNCASGMAFYQGDSYPPLYRGVLFFSDFGQGWIRCARLDAQQQVLGVFSFATGVGPIVDMAEDPLTGDLVYISFGTGTARLRRIRYAGDDLPPVLVAAADPTYGPAPLAVQLRASQSYDPEGGPLQFLWELGDGAESLLPDLDHVYPDPAVTYRARLTVSDAQLWSSSQEFVITPGNTPPQITSFRLPQPGQLYRAGDTILLQAKARDAEDDAAGVALDVQWHVDLIHDHHVHPDFAVAGGPDTSFRTEHHGDGTYYEVRLQVTDSRGLSVSEARPIYDAETRPRAHIAGVSDTTPRHGQAITVTGHMEYPGGRGNHPALVWDWGDGSHEAFQDVGHQQDASASHTYARPGDYELRLIATEGRSKHSAVQPIRVQRPRPAAAVFAPLVAERWISWDEQEELAGGLAADLQALGAEAVVFHYNDQDALVAWMQPYLHDSVRDTLVILDVAPALLYAGEDDGSLAELWMESGNGIVWTGAQPFYEYVTPQGLISAAGAGARGAEEVLDASRPNLVSGLGDQYLTPGSELEVPSLQPFFTWRGLYPDRIGSEWTVDRKYAVDWLGSSDAIALRHLAGGYYAQFYCTAVSEVLPRRAVLGEFLQAYLEP
ncbi:MAG: hypothetical protein EYC70_11550 [Planctomycetota bacterium]|nr:MAG: hypothetical protein EYC70_11550 [Planctomycetota bacterium]